MVGGLIVGAETTKGMLSAPARAVTSPDDGYLPQAPSRPRSTGFTILTRFQASHGWRTSPGSRTRADLNDTTDYALGTQSLSLTTSAAGGTSGVDSPRYSSAVDLRHKTLRVLVKIDGVADLENFRLYAGDADFRNFRPYPLDLNERRTAASYVKDGAWTWVTLNGACGVAIGDGGLPVSRWRLTTSSLPGRRVTVHVNAVEYGPAPMTFPRGVVSICFDDGLLSPFRNAKPKLDQYGWAASEYPIVDRIASSDDGSHLTIAQLRECQEVSGWEIGLHSMTLADHDAGFDTLTLGEIRANLMADRRWLQQNDLGYGEGFAWPLGAFSLSAMKSAAPLCSYGRLNTTRTLETWPPADTMRIRSAANTDSAGRMISMVDETKASRSWLCLTFHEITPDGSGLHACRTETFNKVMDYIAAQRLEVLPMIEVLKKGEAT